MQVLAAIQAMALEDIDQVVEIERQSFPTSWHPDTYRNEVSNPRACYLVAKDGNLVIGFAGMWVAADEAHITTVAVRPEHRRAGIAKRLIVELIRQAIGRKATRITLEVRESNLAAQRLYEGFGFTAVAILSGYYRDTGEDALVMWMNELESSKFQQMLERIEKELSRSAVEPEDPD